ncbi:MAG: hypothetical protein U0441_23435 [Polyangiaceae bacterium]
MRRLEDSCRGIRRPGANQVRDALTRDEQLIDDVLQDVAMVLWQRISAGRIAAARPVIYRFLEQTTWRVARRQALRTAMLHLVAAPVDDDGAWVDVPVPANQNMLEVDITERAPRYRTLLAIHPEVLVTLSPAEREAVVLWTRGVSIEEITSAMQAPNATTRVRLHRARKRIDAFVADELQRAA